MDIADIATEEFVEVPTGHRLAKVRSIFERENPKGIVVTETGDYVGVVTERQLLQSHVQDEAKVDALAKAAPRVDRTEDLREVARMLVEGGVKIAPVFEAGELWGIVTADAILEAVLENLSVLTVDQINTQDVITVTEETRIGQAINLLRENGVSRLPVLDDGRLAGIVTTHDIVDVAVRNMDKATRGDRAGDIERILDIPVYDVMSSPVETTHLGESVRDAVARMLENEYSGLVVTPAPDENHTVAGIVTKTDVLRALTFTEEEYMDVQITNIALLDAISRDDVRRSIEEVAEKYRRMNVEHAHVRFHEHKEKLRGTPLIQCQIRLRTNRGQIAGSGEGYGAESGFRVALDRLERNVIETKGMISDEEYRGQLLRKLDEL